MKTYLLKNRNTGEFVTKDSNKNLSDFINKSSISFGKDFYYVIQEIIVKL